ncbi:AAA family ATPase [Flectobacillus sp. DC10W]|uniref:AAA family ATPase n=1 Tax=Flectobacillus longus TaxID=2984207 RepID=A0ABT6YHA1_9BACT|nr:AAA family ATPase [Flectobacillus longus]MDI9862935.1 AAA family ATPase [Flectobacillus longus]
MKFTKLEIHNFRHISEQYIELGSVMTAIAGQNGTGKSTLLGWISQASDFKQKNKTLLDTPFKSKYSEIFRFCPEKDYNKSYDVSIHYQDGLIDESKKMTTRLIESENRYRVDFDGRGTALDFPVIYLGLKRLIPLATEKSITLHDLGRISADKNQFAKLSKEILYLTRDIIDAEFVTTPNKQILAMKTKDYGHLGNSAGQDNLGQIISSILSFGRLKNELKESYKGGLLLIDEIDATLYAGAQIKLVDKLFALAKSFNVQIVFTTHSLEILEHLSQKTGEETKINFLKWNNKNAINQINPNIDHLKNIIKVQTGQVKKVEKIQFICEDIVAEQWSKNLLNGTDLKGKVEVIKGPFPDGTLIEMANSKHPIFKNTNFILDGDARVNHKSKKTPRTAILPGQYKPEKVFFDFVYSLDDNDEFWDNDHNFIHQTCFGNFSDNNHKRWFNDISNQQYFGKGCSRLFNRWKKDNKEAVDQFINEIKLIIK